MTTRVDRLDWAHMWQTVWGNPIWSLMLQVMGLLVVAMAVETLLSGPWSFLVRTYVLVLMLALVVGYMVQARWWLVWLIGTQIWTAGCFVLCLWQLSVLAGG